MGFTTLTKRQVGVTFFFPQPSGFCNITFYGKNEKYRKNWRNKESEKEET
jgi:hypothetical protein